MPATHPYDGQCHCGALRVHLELSRPAQELGLRSCQCGFCRPRGVTTVGDPHGAATLTASREKNLIRYRFGHRIADYILCATCGTYVGAVQDEGGRLVATINVGGLAVTEFADRRGDPVDYGDEPPDARRKRRSTAWMPLTVTFTDAS
jgi:hypothetical protein